MDEWHVGDPADWGDSVGVPDILYMGYLQDDDEDEKDFHHHKTYSQRLVDEAWRLRQDYRNDEALDKINRALKTCASGRAYNIKAIILEDMGDYEGALYNYKQALQRKHPPQLSRIIWQGFITGWPKAGGIQRKSPLTILTRHWTSQRMNLTGWSFLQPKVMFLKILEGIVRHMCVTSFQTSSSIWWMSSKPSQKSFKTRMTLSYALREGSFTDTPPQHEREPLSI